MLRSHYLSQEGPANSDFGAPDFRNRFQTELDNTGWPQNLRRIAVVNGRIDGGLDYSSCQTALSSWTWLTFTKHIPVLPASSGEVKFIPASGTDYCTVFDGKYLFKHSYFRLKTTNSSITNIDVAPGGLFNTQHIIKTDGAGFAGITGKLFSYTYFPVYVSTHSFIPTVSSLAITNGLNRSLTEDFSNRNLVTAGETPFHTYYAPNANEAHVSLTACSAAWITNEINGINQAPVGNNTPITGSGSAYQVNLSTGASVTWSVTGGISICGSASANPVTVMANGSGSGTLTANITSAVCGNTTASSWITVTPPAINGPDQFCNNPASYPAGYLIENVPANSTTTWSATGAIAISGSNTGSYGYVVPTGSDGMGTLTASTYYPDCGTTIISNKDIMVGTPPWQEVIMGLDDVYVGNSYPVQIGAPYPGATSYSWSTSFGAWVAYENGVTAEIGADSPGYHTIYVTAHTECGDVVLTWEFYAQENYLYSYSIYPNPAGDELTVSYDTKTAYSHNSGLSIGSKVVNAKTFGITLFDEKGKALRTLHTNTGEKSVKIDTRDIPNGIYFLHINEGKKVTKKQIIIQH